MKYVKLLFFVILCTAFFSCSDDESFPQELTADYFEHSAWTGKHIIITDDNRGETRPDHEVNFVFAKNKGKLKIYQYKGYDGVISDAIIAFNYTVDNKKLNLDILSPMHLRLGSDWFATHIEADSLVLTTDPEALLGSETLYLTRIY